MRLTIHKVIAIAGAVLLTTVGTQLVTSSVASAHTPSASLTCTTWSIGGTNYSAAESNTYSYSIDGAAAVTGGFGTAFGPISGTFAAGSGNHTLVGYVYQNNNPNAQYSHTYNLSTTGCSTYIPIPAAPLPTPPTCGSAGAATIPADTATVHWTLNGNVATATAQGSNRFTDGSSTKSFTENPLPKLDANSDTCAVHVVATAPVFTNGDCNTAPSMSGAVGGTGYTVAVSGTVGFGNTVTVTFAALPNFRLDGQKVFTFTYGPQPDCRILVSPVKPDVTQATCDHTTGVDSGFTITPATTEGITYSVNDLVVTATADSTFKFGALAAGWVSVSDTVATYTATRTDPVCLIDVTLVAPVVTQSVCTGPGTSSAPSVIPAQTAGVSYVVAEDLSTVTAMPASGYEFAMPLPAGWTMQEGSAVFQTNLTSPGACLIAVSPVAPTLTQSACTGSGTTPSTPTLTLADTANVTYTVADGPYAGGQTVVVTATAANGYTFTAGELPVGWTVTSEAAATTATFPVTFDAAPQCAIAAAAVFSDNVCQNSAATGATFTLTAATGVDYLVDGVVQSTGTHTATDGSTVTVTAQAQQGYTLTGTAQWTHTFGSTPSCAAVAGSTKGPVTQPVSGRVLAATGMPLAWLVLWGSVLALMGAALAATGAIYGRRSAK